VQENRWRITVVEHCYFKDVARGQSYYGAHNNKNADETADQPANISVIQGYGHNILLDTGFSSPHFVEMCNAQNLLTPEEYLAPAGIGCEDIDTVIISHMHYDHADQIDQFPNAQVYVQEKEYEGWKAALQLPDKFSLITCYLEEHTMEKFLRIEAEGRLHVVGDETEVFPGIRLYLTPGHSFGCQTVLVQTERGPVALCADAAYTVENVTQMVPMGYGLDQLDMLKSFDRIWTLVQGKAENIVPGHDLNWPDRYSGTYTLQGKVNRVTRLGD